MPVDFEVVNVNSALESEDDINNAITAIRRNGVALKGKQTSLFCSVTIDVGKHGHGCKYGVICTNTMKIK